jgi:hypothetical protein
LAQIGVCRQNWKIIASPFQGQLVIEQDAGHFIVFNFVVTYDALNFNPAAKLTVVASSPKQSVLPSSNSFHKASAWKKARHHSYFRTATWLDSIVSSIPKILVKIKVLLGIADAMK